MVNVIRRRSTHDGQVHAFAVAQVDELSGAVTPSPWRPVGLHSPGSQKPPGWLSLGVDKRFAGRSHSVYVGPVRGKKRSGRVDTGIPSSAVMARQFTRKGLGNWGHIGSGYLCDSGRSRSPKPDPGAIYPHSLGVPSGLSGVERPA